MTSRSLLSKWLVEYTSPVVVTVCTAEAESICLKNGLLFHELLSAFGHLDNISATVRSVNHQIPVVDAHIRFERSSEVVPKSSGTIEQLLRDSFTEYDISKLPGSPDDLKASPPSGWSPRIEQTLMRSMSFTEYEMTSHPLVFLTVVATSDIDHIACMQELSSVHHVPPCFATGQYDPDIHRVYLLLHDVSAGPSVDASLLLRQLKSKFSPTHTKLLCINSLSEEMRNLTHPDIWERWRIPMFFPQHAPAVPEKPLHSGDEHTPGTAVGSRLSMEDYMSLRNFCIDLFQQEILPAYERRVGVLLRHVNESKRGVKNVLKSFWRRPRDNTAQTKGVAKYRYDRIETQILLLADAAFSMRDYDAALSMYRLVKDDYKADKSTLHIAHTYLMMAACQFMMDPSSRTRELTSYVDTIVSSIAANTELLHANAYYAFIMTEILASNTGGRAPLEAVQILLQAAGTVSKLPMLSALMTERAAQYCILARQDRKYCLHVVLSGHKFKSCGILSAENHASVCFAAAMVIHDEGVWGTVKSRLWRTLADKFRTSGTAEGSRKALLLLLQILSAVSSDGETYSGTVALVDAVNVYHELIHDKSWGALRINKGWDDMRTRDILLDSSGVDRSVPTKAPDIDRENAVDLIVDDEPPPSVSLCAMSPEVTIIEDLRIPEIFMESVVIMVHLNGSTDAVAHGSYSSTHAKIDLLKNLLDVEKSLELMKAQADSIDTLVEMCAEKFVMADSSLSSSDRNRSSAPASMGGAAQLVSIPLGEKVVIKMNIHNPLPVELSLRDFQIQMNSPDSFDVSGVDVILPSGASKTITLIATPLCLGSFHVDSASWYLGDRVKIIQHIKKKGPMQQKTLSQRAARDRARDSSLMFNIIQTWPALRIDIPANMHDIDVLCDEVVKTEITLHNDGGTFAKHIHLIFSSPVVAVEMMKQQQGVGSHAEADFLPFFGQSCTAVHLPPNTVISPGKSIALQVFLRLTEVGRQEISLLASYKATAEDKVPRTSCSSFAVNVESSIDMNISIVARHAAPTAKSFLISMLNRIPTDDLANNYGIITPIHGGVDIPEVMTQSGDGCFCATGILFLGGGIPSGEIVGAVDTSRNEKNVANTSECLSLFVPVSLLSAAEIGERLQHLTSSFWILDLDTTAAEMRYVFEMFCYTSFCSQRLRSEMARARIKIREAELSGNDAQPRTISQVRKDRSLHRSTSDLLLDDKASLARDVEIKAKSIMDVIVSSEMRTGQATVAVAWVCHWRGQLHHGISVQHHQQLHKSTGLVNDVTSVPAPPRQKGGALLSPSNSLTPSQVVTSELLSVGFMHPHSQVWDFNCGRCPINVELGLHSTSATRTMLVSVEALEWIDIRQQQQSLVLQSARRKRPPLKGLHWEGKSRYVDVVLMPLATLKLPFLALISRRGVYDVKRFRVTVRFTDDDEMLPSSVKVLEGQSLVAILESKPATTMNFVDEEWVSAYPRNLECGHCRNGKKYWELAVLVSGLWARIQNSNIPLKNTSNALND